MREHVCVLVVDDDPLQREIIAEKLKYGGYAVVAAADGSEAWEILQTSEVDLVISDLEMPNMNGYQLIDRIRDSRTLSKLPIVVITGSEDVDACDRAFTAGATSFLPKPINWSLFMHSLWYVLRGAARENELRAAREMSLKASRQKDAILAIISHELRTPLHAITGFSRLLVDEPHGPIGHDAYREYAKTMSGAGDRMALMIKEILLLSKLLAADFEAILDEYPLPPLIGDLVDEFSPSATAKGAVIEVDGSLRLPADLQCQRELLVRALGNLLDNAVNAAPQGSTITLALRHDDDSVVISVADRGPGIPRDKVEQMFEAFVQGEDVLSRRCEGLGIGLTVARSVARAHGGELELICAPGDGVTAELRLPAKLYCAQAHCGAQTLSGEQVA